MPTNDTKELLRECDSGIRMGLDSIDDILDNVKDERLRRVLEDCRSSHAQLSAKAQKLLSRYGEPEGEAHPIAKGMSWLKTNVKMAVMPDDSTAAGLITDGCDMGIKSLEGYLNRYERAESEAVQLAREVIRSEEKLRDGVKEFL